MVSAKRMISKGVEEEMMGALVPLLLFSIAACGHAERRSE